MLTGLCKNPNNPAIPSIVLANVRFLANKMDKLRMQFGTHKLVNCCLLIITVTLLDSLTLGVAIKLACYMVHRPDRSREDRNSKVGVYACVLMIGAVKNKNSRQPLLRDLKVCDSQMQTLLPPK